MQIDPVCGMQVDENTAQYKVFYLIGNDGIMLPSSCE